MAGYKVVIGYDGTNQANAAIDDLQRAGLPDSFEAVVLSVSDVWIPEGSDPEPPTPRPGVAVTESHAVRALRDTHHLAETGRDRLQILFPNAHVRAEARADNPAWALLEKVNEWSPDLVVVGAHSHNKLGRVILGSVSQKVLAEAHCSVRIGRQMRTERGSGVRVLVGVDGSRDARAALREIARRTWPADTLIRLIVAYSPVGLEVMPSLTPPPSEGQNQFEDETLQRARQQVHDALELFSERGLSAEPFLRVGSPVAVLVEEAEEWHSDVVFLGARGHRVLERLFLGSVSSAVAERVGCSVEVIRPWRGNEDESETG